MEVLHNAREAAILATGLDAIITIDGHGLVREFNPAAERVFGRRRADVLGRELAELLVPPALREAHRRGLARYLATGEAHVLDRRIEVSALRADGTEFPIELAITRIPGDGPPLFTAFIRDISERVRAEHERLVEDLRRRAEALAEADRRKDELLVTLAHELRNPLAPIRNALQIMRLRGGNDPAVDSARGIIERQVQYLTRLIEDLLDVARITRGKVQLRKERVDLSATATLALEVARPLIEKRRHRLSVELAAEPLRLEADPVRLEQVITNLLNNAAKYTDPGGHITLTTAREGGEAVLRVRDTGIGISAEMQPRVFDLFIQADRALDRAQGGLGIGLTLARRLVELHGGTIHVASPGPGRGSEFSVRLPLAGRAEEAAAPAAPPPPAAEAGRAKRVVVVDDNRDGAESLAMLLRFWGHDTFVAHDGRAALTVVAAEVPDVVLLDIGLPGMDGYEVARALRERLDSRPVLVALTGYGQDEDRRRSREAGFDHHLTKPVDPEALKGLLAAPPAPAEAN